MTETVTCDVTELVNLPTGDLDNLPSLDGVSAKQVNWGEVVRSEKLEEWEPDLPEPVLKALGTLTDSTWWIANREAEAGDIKWPKAWVEQRAVGRNGPAPSRRPPPPSAPPSPAKRVLEEAKAVRDDHLANFDEFARKMCKSPELAYLTIMAMAVRQNKDPKVRAKYDEVRGTIQGHLNAIDNIANG